MDPVTQGALGAAATLAIAPRSRVFPAALLGGLSGMAPDLDVLIRSSTDPLLSLEYHRQFTHALLFIPVGGLGCAVALFAFVRTKLGFLTTYGYCCLGYATHGLLDACTSYGTQLLWPFSTLRVAWNNVSVVDPLLTLPLLALLLLAVFRRAPRLARAGLAWVLLYLAIGLVQRERATWAGWELARSRGQTPAAVVAKPSFANLVLWKTIYEYQGIYYVDAVRLLGTSIVFSGQTAPALKLARDYPWLTRQTQQARDVERFRWFSEGFIARDPDRPARVIDIRYSVVPNRIEALWGIELDASAPADAHARFFTSRELSPEDRAELTQMLWPPPRD